MKNNLTLWILIRHEVSFLSKKSQIKGKVEKYFLSSV